LNKLLNHLPVINAAFLAAFFLANPTLLFAQAPTNKSTPIVAETSAPVRVLLVPARETTLVAQMIGRVDRLGGEMGGSFASGAVLANIDCQEHNARLKMSEAEYAAAKEQHEAKLRLQGLQAAGEVEVQMAASAANKSRAQIELTKAQMRLCIVHAPFAGRIVKLHVKQYQGVNVGQPIMDIVSAGPLKLRMNAPSKWLSWLKVGSTFEVTIDETGKSYPATVSAMNGRVDAASQSIEIEGQVRGSFKELLAGMSGNARFAANR
jgi:membrane fusion protein, multidrug efflux system